MHTFSAGLHFIMNARHISIKTLSAESGVSANHLARIIKQFHEPTERSMANIAKALNLNISDIYKIGEEVKNIQFMLHKLPKAQHDF